jgi:hypothetical protein
MGPWDIACELTRTLIERDRIQDPIQAGEALVAIHEILYERLKVIRAAEQPQ